MILLVGLGNPGNRYENTRHNIGFKVMDEIANRQRITLNHHKYDSLTGKFHMAGTEIMLMKPQTFMNLSGRAVQKAATHLQLASEQIMVSYDDIDLPLGRIRIKSGGGSAGHNGIKSIAETLQSQNFLRLRIGVGRPPDYQDPADYVLEEFLPDEADLLAKVITGSADAIFTVIHSGIEKAMSKYNRRDYFQSDAEGTE